LLQRGAVGAWHGRSLQVLSQCDPVGNGVDTSLLEHVSLIERDNVVLYGQHVGVGEQLSRKPV
jgi:hypothetical protein